MKMRLSLPSGRTGVAEIYLAVGIRATIPPQNPQLDVE